MTEESEPTRSWQLYGDMVSDGQTHLHTDLIKQSEHQNVTWHETQGLMPALVRSNGLRAEKQQLCRDPCKLFECMLTSVSAVVRVSDLDHCANNDWDFILHHTKHEYYWRWYLLLSKIYQLIHPKMETLSLGASHFLFVHPCFHPREGCKETKLRWKNLNFFCILHQLRSRDLPLKGYFTQKWRFCQKLLTLTSQTYKRFVHH